MQIHELNPFQGTLGSEAFLVVDNGDDTGKISVERLTQPINDRIDDIITSPAPTEQEIIDARRGWNEVVYGSLGTAIRSQVKQILAQFYKFNTYDLLSVYGTPISRTRNGVTFTWDDAGQVCEVSGEAVGGDAYASIYTQTGAWPGIFEHGVVYTIGYETTDPNVKLRIAVWEGVETTPDYYYFDENGYFGIPSEVAKISVDLWVASGDTVSAVVKNVYMLQTYTAKEVKATIRDAMIGADRHMYSSLGDAIREQMNGKVDKEEGMGLSQNSFTDAEQAKLEGVATGAQVNVIETVKVDGTPLTPDENKAIDIPVDDTLTEAGTPAEAKAVGDELENKANIDGYYETFTSGQTEQIIATEAITDTEPYNYRKTGGANDVGDRVYDEIVGGSVVWNQLVDSGATEVTVPNGHKYYANINGTKSIGASTGTAISINDSTEDNVIDLTAAVTPLIADYIYSLEQANAGAGVAYFKKYFPEEYYEYCEPRFEHVQTSGKVTIGFNQWDEEWVNGTYNAQGVIASSNRYMCSKNLIPVLPSTQYYLKSPDVYFEILSYDENKNYLRRIASSAKNRVVTMNDKTHYIAFGSATADAYTRYTPGDICINIHGDRDGEYEPYKKRTYPLDSSLTLRGIPKLDSANRLYFDGDVYEHDGTVTRRYGIRAYQSGDESLADAITDGTNTVYKLTTPTTETAEPFQSPMVVDPLGTEEFVDYGVEEGARDVAIPVGHTSEYPADLRGKLQHLPSLASADGRYVVVQTGNQMTLSPDTSLGLIAALEARVAALEGGN